MAIMVSTSVKPRGVLRRRAGRDDVIEILGKLSAWGADADTFVSSPCTDTRE